MGRGVFRCALAALLFGLSTPFASRLLEDFSPLTLAGLLYLGAALCALVPALRSGVPLGAARTGGRLLFISVACGGVLGPAFLMLGLVRVEAASASLLLNFELSATVLVAVFAFREHLGVRLGVAVGLVTTASLLLSWRPGAGFEPAALLIVTACLFWGADNAASARVDRIPVAHLVVVKGLTAAAVNVGLGFVVGASGPVAAVPAALAVGAVGYGCSILLWVSGAREIGAARAQLVFSTAPFLGALAAWTFFGDPVTAVQLVAALLAGIGVLVSFASGHGHAHRHVPLEHDHEHDHGDMHHGHGHGVCPGGSGRHTHRHRHEPLVHDHVHVPDLHHLHDHR